MKSITALQLPGEWAGCSAGLSSAGALQASYELDPYGRYLSQSGTLATTNVMRFSSKPWVGFNGSTTASLYYYCYRFYDPYLQRWANRDPVEEEAGFGLYAFGQNTPLIAFDPDGLRTWEPASVLRPA